MLATKRTEGTIKSRRVNPNISYMHVLHCMHRAAMHVPGNCYVVYVPPHPFRQIGLVKPTSSIPAANALYPSVRVSGVWTLARLRLSPPGLLD